MKHLWWIGSLISMLLIGIIRFTDWRPLPSFGDADDCNYTIETISFSYLAGAIFYLLNESLPNHRRKNVYRNHILRQIKMVNEDLRQMVYIIEPFNFSPDKSEEAFCDSFAKFDFLAPCPFDNGDMKSYILKSRDEIENVIEDLLAAYGNYMDKRELDFANSVLDSFFICNNFYPRIIDVEDELLSSYFNNQNEYGKSIFRIWKLSNELMMAVQK